MRVRIYYGVRIWKKRVNRKNSSKEYFSVKKKEKEKTENKKE